MAPTLNPVGPKTRAVQWRKRPDRHGPLAPSGGGARKRPRGVLCRQRWASCLCTSRRLYEPFGEVQFNSVSKFRFDAIRPAVRNSHPTQREPAGASVVPSSRDLHDVPESRGTSPRSPPTPFHDRLDPPVTSPLTSPVITMDTKKSPPGAPHPAQGRRKGGGGGGQQQLRSPVVKRPAAAPVTLQGWLHKQGSEGLMLWKRRWFVLSEYCLFYYKGPEEEKLLGSILLPSYKISPCSTEDRVYRKFAFKAEHTNMRTYHFSADTLELMVRWMNALSLASILQEGSSQDDHRSARPSVTSASSVQNQSADESDSGFHGYRQPHSMTAGTPCTVAASSSSKLSNEDASRQLNTSNDSVFSNGWGLQKQGTGGHQPLYANAPPKPRRLAEHEDYGASSPETASDRQPEELAGKRTPQDPEGNKGFVPRIAQPQQPVRNECVDIRYRYHQPAVQKPVHSCDHPVQDQLQRQQEPSQQVVQGSGSYAQVLSNVERRTPDTYGRSNSTTPGPTGQSRVMSVKGRDYEDVYNVSDSMRHSGSEGSYRDVNKRSSSQVAYIKGAGPVISIHHKQNFSERGHGDDRPSPQGGGQYGQSGQLQRRYASGIPSQQPDMCAPNTYSAHVQQKPLPPHHHPELVRHRETQPNRYPPRPHSADFLDYDAKRHNQHYSCQPLYFHGQETNRSRDFLQYGAGGDDKSHHEQHASRVARIQRPKSSLEMMPPSNPAISDNYYWSEECYAQKMRQSASYVHQIPTTHPRNQSSSSRATTPSTRLSTPSGFSAQVGGVSSGGSVNSESASVVLRHPKRTDQTPNYATTVRSPSRQQYHQQRRWSEYQDTGSNGQFTRSASARLPRQRYQDDENDSQCEEQWQKSASDVRDGEKKIQQREESMKRLLEWKQRMLQSPLTRKPSGSSSRGLAQNELSKYYKQQVLRELASQEARSKDVTNIHDGRISSKRRSQLEESGTVPGRSVLRSRSQDGRRSSTSLSRYNSYSSDDEELSDVRKARKRVRRPSQAGRSRHGSAEGKPSRHHHHTSVPLHICADMHSTPKYENVTAPFNTKSDHSHRMSSDSKVDVSKSRIHKSSLSHNRDKIPPDLAYKKGEHTVERLRSPESRLTELTNGKMKCPELLPLQGEAPYHIDSSPAQKILFSVKSSGDSSNLQDDRCSNGKHSDSGYDTLQAGRVVPGFTELLKFQNTNVNAGKACELVYPVYELHWDRTRVREAEKGKEEWNMKLSGSQTVKSPHDPGGSNWKGEESKDFIHSVESPPKNIVQSRIKVFEIGKEGEESVLGRESLQMKEPLKMSPPMYHPNEAHVSSLKNGDQQQPKADDSPRRRRRKSDLCNFVFAGGGGSTRKITSADLQFRSQKNTVESEKYAKSVRDLLADFERKSQLVKERQAAEEKRSSEGGPRKRCVFSDTETLLYDTSSDAEGHSEDVKPTTEHSIGREEVETRNDPACSAEDEDDKDDEVAAALGRREGFSSSCRDLGRSRDADYRRCRKRETSKDSIAAADPTTSDDLEVIVTPGYLRLSMAESLVTHEDSESVCSTPTNSQQCSTSDGTGDKKPEDTTSALANVEEYYMPMTPSRKAMLAPPEAFSSTRSPSASHTVIMENIFGGDGCEESSYVEMTEDGIIRSLLAPEPNVSFLSKLDLKIMNANDSAYATPESPRYCEVGSTGKGNSGVASHYEFLFKASTQYEPVYMEVSPLLEALTSQDKLDLTKRTKSEGGKKRDNSDSSTIQDSSEKSKSMEEDGVVPLPPTPPRPSLPDILNSSSTSGQQQQQKVLPKSDRDSSDADDEASKDLDSLDAPRHPRFSLSDTFRPASYYLGASSMNERALLALGGVAATVEQHDSSDSDLVSPPPIPTSPPPLDDFDNSLELHDATLDVKKHSPLPATGVSGAECNERDEPAILWNKPPGPTNVIKPSDNNENSLSSSFLPPPIYCSGDINSSGSESIDPRNDNDSKNIDRLIKRRPVTDDIFGVLSMSGYLPPSPHVERRSASSDLESVGSRSGLAMDLDDGVSIDLDKYLEDLQARDSFNGDIYSKDSTYDYNRSCGHEINGLNADVDNVPQKTEPMSNKSTNDESEDAASLGRDLNCCFLDRSRILGESFRYPDTNFAVERDDSGLSPHYEQTSARSEEVQYENMQLILPPPPQHASDPVFVVPNTASPSDGAIRRGDQTCCNVDPHGLDSEHTGAPYYYSDLLKGDEDGFVSSISERSVNCSRGYPCSSSAPVIPASRAVTSTASRSEPLNNQREDVIESSCSSKRNGIGRKVNAIHQISPSLTVASIHAPKVPSIEDETRRLAEELRSTTVHFLGAANKRGQVDERNLYEADTIQRHKAVSLRGSDQAHENRHRLRTLDFHAVTNAVNLYPHGLRDKSSPPTRDELSRNCSRHPQRRSRSLEGLIDGPDVLEVYNETQPAMRSSRVNRMLQSSELAVSLTDVCNIRPTHPDRNEMTAGVSTQWSQELQGGVISRHPAPVPKDEGSARTEGDDLWEEDTLWRESLRRVSLRHTRSLDNLDGEHVMLSNSRLSNVGAMRTTSAMEHSDHVPGGGCVRQKISREVTYVNDSMVRTSHQRPDCARHREYEEDYREGRRRIRKRPQQSQGLISDDVASWAERDDGVHYERLSRNSESLERARRGQIFLEGYIWDEDQETFRKPSATRHQRQSQQQNFLEHASRPQPSQPPLSFEIDREKLRQWDLMSSAPLLQQQILVAKQSLVVGGTVSGVVVAGTDGEEPLPGTGGSQQQQQQPWHLLHLTMPLAAETDLTTQGEESSSQSPGASGSGSVIGRDPLPPRAMSAVSLQQQVKDSPPPTITLTSEGSPQDHSASISLARKASPSHLSALDSPNSAGNLERPDPVDGQGKRNRVGGGGGGSNSSGSGPWGINVSAGELLGRTHEELVLLLIQLRRQSAGVCKAMETCHFEIEAQARLSELEMPKRLEHLQKLDELKRHLLDLEKQYEKGKPLVNLVDNMVKLGSLYRGSGTSLHSGTGRPSDVHVVRERLEFNQKVQEQRLLAEERRDWDRVSPDRGQLQAKVQELYRLDRLLQEESGTLQSLQQDKELLEKALGGLRHKLQGSRASPAEAERYRKQQRLLEKELSRIRLLLAHNSKKLEETVAENARLEQELVVLRQKLQASWRGSQQRPALPLIPDSVSTSTTAALEAELRRVQQLVGDLQRQRQELSIQVRHLTEKSHSLVQQIRPGPTGVAGAGPIPGRKRHHSTWLETDLDSLVTLDHGLDSPASPQHPISPPGSKIQPVVPPVDGIAEAPLYVNTDASSKQAANQNIYKGPLVDGEDLVPPPVPAPPELPPDYPPPPPPPPSDEAVMNGGIGQQYCTHMDISEADDRMKRFYGIIPREKQQEIKTVRIVKRESERRQRDRDRSGNIGIPITNGTTSGKRVTIVEDGDTGTSQYPVEKQQLGCVLEEEPQDKQFSEELVASEDPELAQLQRSMSLPRGFGKREQLGYQQQQVVPPLPPVRVPSPRSDSVTVLRNLMINRHRVRFESYSGGSSSSAESTSSQRAVSPSRSLTAYELLFGVNHDEAVSRHYAITSPGSSDVSPQLSPVFKSEAARAIVMEMSSMRDSAGHNMEHQPRRRAVPKEKRRHHTVSSSQPLFGIETTASPIMGSARSRDDLDMERALRPRLNTPDVVRSTMSQKDFKYNENTIDSILGTPNKIVIPERYIPEQAPELSAEEKMRRLKKAEAIRKMLSETTSVTASDSKEKEEEQTSTLKKKVAAEKKQREHLLQLNQILAKQVMEKSKMVAGSTSVPSLE